MPFEELDNDQCLDDEDCDVEVLDERSIFDNTINTKWNDIKTVEEETLSFCSWWPETASLILKGIYGLDADKKIAIAAFMKIFEYKPVYINSLTLSVDMYEFHNLYSQKLKIHEEHMTVLTNVWCDILRECTQYCKDINTEYKNEMNRLKQKANELFWKLKQQSMSHHIVKEEYEKTMNELRKEYNFKTQLIKTPFYRRSMVNDTYSQDIRKINSKINAMLSDSSYSTVQDLDKQYKEECNNLEYKICAQIQNECEQYWMHGLL